MSASFRRSPPARLRAFQSYISAIMHSFLPALVIVFALATLGVLIVGVVSMMRGGEFNRRNSNKLMRARVILQGVTLALLALMFFAR